MSRVIATSPVHRKFVKQDSVKAKALAKASVAEQVCSSSQIISLEEKYGAHKWVAVPSSFTSSVERASRLSIAWSLLLFPLCFPPN